MDAWGWGAVGAVLAVLAALGSAAGRVGKSLPYEGKSHGTYKRPPPELNGYDVMREHGARIGDLLGLSQRATDELTMQLLAQANTESGARNLVGLGIPERYPPWTHSSKKETMAELMKRIATASGSEREKLERTYRLRANEAKAAERGYDRRGSYDASPYPRGHWVFGSGGYYGQLPSTALSSFRPGKTGHAALKSGDIHPWDVFDPWRSSVMQADFIRRIMVLPHFRKLPLSEQSMKAIKRAAAGLFLVDDIHGEHERAAKINAAQGKRVAKFGYPPSAASATLSRELVEKWPDGGAWEVMKRGEET